MRTTFNLNHRIFPVKVRDARPGEEKRDVIVLDKSWLQAAQIVGQSSKELIERNFSKQGFRVLEIGKAMKLPVELYLDKVCEWLLSDEEELPVADR